MADRRVLLIGLALVACGEPIEIGDGRRFVDDDTFRRNALEASLVDPSNGYSSVRLEKYGHVDQGWDTLPIYDPTRIATDFDWSHEALVETGRQAFEAYPLSPANGLGDGRHGEHALVEAEGVTYKTCATCHARDDDGTRVYGAANVDLDLGGALGASWGLGHVDPTPDGMHNPTGITDLRPIRYQNHLNVAASIQNSLVALAVRIETLMITSAGEQRRPPRELAFAIAYFLWSLGEPVHTPPTASAGRTLFQANCARCHHADGTTAEPVALDVVMTDPAAGLSPMRGTGRYRIPSLYGVGDRRRVLHHGQVRSLSELLDPDRTEPGHPFGQQLDAADRAELIRFLETL